MSEWLEFFEAEASFVPLEVIHQQLYSFWIGKRPGELKLFSLLPGDLVGIYRMLRGVALGRLISPIR